MGQGLGAVFHTGLMAVETGGERTQLGSQRR